MQYPNARLFIHSLLSDNRVSGSQAIVQGAYEFGLVPDGSIQPVVEGGGLPCRCMDALKNVLIKYFEERQKHSPAPFYDLKEIWSAVEKDADTYIEKSIGSEQCAGIAQVLNCKKLAPALFDILLQQIRRYP